VANGNNLTGIGLAPGKTIFFGSLEFTADCFGNLSLSPEGDDLGVVFVVVVHSRPLSLHTVLEESYDEGNATMAGGVSCSFLSPRGCNVVTQAVPITTTPPLESTPALPNIPTVQMQTTEPQPSSSLLGGGESASPCPADGRREWGHPTTR
jgi:hypothetical protein